DAQLVWHRVWTQTTHINKQLSTLALAAEDTIQQALRNEYSNIVEYNRDAGALAEPFRFLVWSSMPSGLDDQGWKHLQSLLDSGARCGIIPIMVVDPDLSWPTNDQSETLSRRGLHVRYDSELGRFVANRPGQKHLEFLPPEAPSDKAAQSIVNEVGRRSLLSNRVEVPLEKMVPPAEQRWQGDSSRALEIPIGQSGVGRTHCLTLGVGTAQHAIIAGKTGSGKSSLLHALITSAMLKYSPESLRLVLLDFKKGVEFQTYSDAEVPHADIIGIESHREFGLSALEYVDGCMQRRGESFRAAGVQDIASWNALHPDEPKPRMLVVVDEFQELFVEDDKLSGQASLILDRIVRQGRSFGVHAVLSSQTLAGSYSLPRTTLGQMAVRIALQCDASDAQIIFSEDNPAAARLKHPGQAVYNDAGGRIEGNQPMQIGWLPKQKQVEWFAEQHQGYRNADATTNLLGRTVIYDGNRAATWSEANANLAIHNAKKEINPDAIWCVAGESVAINPAVVFPMTRQAGRNVLIAGSDDSQAASLLDVATYSFIKNANRSGSSPQVFCIQGAKPTDANALRLPDKWKTLDCEYRGCDARDTDNMIAEVHALVQSRVEAEDETDQSPVLLNLIQLGRMRTLRKEDDFASFGESTLSPDKQLEEILRDGPSVGIHAMIWAEGYSTVNRWLSRTALREIEIRMLMQMSGNDSTNLIDSIAASKLGEHVMLLFDEAT
ncbi:MAG: FtsK/SpoIIIE domain-containing protein, partial [Planctomycetota bacterium]